MSENKLIKLVKATDSQPSKFERSVLLNSLLKRSSEKILNIEFLLGKTTNQPFLDVEFPFNFDTSCFESEVTNSCLLEETKDTSHLSLETAHTNARNLLMYAQFRGHRPSTYLV